MVLMDEIQNIYIVYLTVSDLVQRDAEKNFAREGTGEVVLARKKCTNKSIIGRRNNMLMGAKECDNWMHLERTVNYSF